MSEPTISYEAWQKEIDAIRKGSHGLTDEQFRFVDYARNHEHPIHWPKILILFNKTFGTNLAKTTLYEWYDRRKQKENKQ